MNAQIDTAGMGQDKIARKKQRFTPENHLIMAGPRQTSKQRQRRLEKWMDKFTDEQILAQLHRYRASIKKFRPGWGQDVSAWRI